MELKVDTIVNPALFEDEDTELVELAIVAKNSAYCQMRGCIVSNSGGYFIWFDGAVVAAL